MNEILTETQAIKFHDSGIWKTWSHDEIVRFQLFQDKLCIPFRSFHETVEKVLDRPVFTHEFGLNYEGIILEYLGEREPPTMSEIMSMIPEEKRMLILVK